MPRLEVFMIAKDQISAILDFRNNFVEVPEEINGSSSSWPTEA